jgi:hypothetical protein
MLFVHVGNLLFSFPGIVVDIGFTIVVNILHFRFMLIGRFSLIVRRCFLGGLIIVLFAVGVLLATVLGLLAIVLGLLAIVLGLLVFLIVHIAFF